MQKRREVNGRVEGGDTIGRFTDFLSPIRQCACCLFSEEKKFFSFISLQGGDKQSLLPFLPPFCDFLFSIQEEK